MQKENKDVVIVVDNNVPVIRGECTQCKRGDKSLVIVDFVPSRLHNINSTVYIRCVCCNSLYQTKVKDLSR